VVGLNANNCDECLKPLAPYPGGLAEKLDISQNRLNEIIRGKRGVTADTALRLSKVFKTSPEFWMNLPIAKASN
jgi:addiction module HigA family antidote